MYVCVHHRLSPHPPTRLPLWSPPPPTLPALALKLLRLAPPPPHPPSLPSQYPHPHSHSHPSAAYQLGQEVLARSWRHVGRHGEVRAGTSPQLLDVVAKRQASTVDVAGVVLDVALRLVRAKVPWPHSQREGQLRVVQERQVPACPHARTAVKVMASSTLIKVLCRKSADRCRCKCRQIWELHQQLQVLRPL